MKNRYDIVAEAVEECLKECYKLAQPKVTWEDFKKENKEYMDNNYKERDIPAPYSFYYLPKEEFTEIINAVASAYGLEDHIHNDAELLINYLKNPTIVVYNKELGRHYEHIEGLDSILDKESFDKVMDYIHKYMDYYKGDHYANSYNFNVCLGASPNTNKDAVIENWKKYRNKDITINDNIYDEDSSEDW